MENKFTYDIHDPNIKIYLGINTSEKRRLFNYGLKLNNIQKMLNNI